MAQPFVLAHKLREAMAASAKGLRIGGEGRAAEIDGASFGGHVRPESRSNADYADHRRSGFGMSPPEVRLVPPGTFAAWMRRRGKLGGQNKVLRVIDDPALLADLNGFARGT